MKKITKPKNVYLLFILVLIPIIILLKGYDLLLWVVSLSTWNKFMLLSGIIWALLVSWVISAHFDKEIGSVLNK